MANNLIWAVAGARKTQMIVDHCARSVPGKLRLALTFTRTGQGELTRRTSDQCPEDGRPEVLGWYTFLIHHWVRPLLWSKYPGRRIPGFNFEGDPGRYATGTSAFFDRDGQIYRRNLAKLACELNGATGGMAVQRLEGIYSEILIDEIQDLNGWDLEVIDALLPSNIDLTMVGDTRQCVYSTNPQDAKNKQFKLMAVREWFEHPKRRPKIAVTESSETHRSVQEIATFADTIFPSRHSFPATISAQKSTNEHQGLWSVRSPDVSAYHSKYHPLLLTWDRVAGQSLPHPSRNLGEVKGMTSEHVLILPTKPIIAFLRAGNELTPSSAGKLYVGVTRAVFSVGIIHDRSLPGFTVWQPPEGIPLPWQGYAPDSPHPGRG